RRSLGAAVRERVVSLHVLLAVLLDETRELLALGGIGAAKAAQRRRRAGDDRGARDLARLHQRLTRRPDLGRVDPLQKLDQPVALLAHRRLERLPPEVSRRLDGLLVGRLPALDLRLAGEF